MSYSEEELAQMSWEDIAVHMHFTLIQRHIVSQCLKLSSAAWLVKRLRNNSVDYIYWLTLSQKEADPLDNTSNKESLNSRERFEDTLYLMNMHLQAHRRALHEATNRLPMRA